MTAESPLKSFGLPSINEMVNREFINMAYDEVVHQESTSIDRVWSTGIYIIRPETNLLRSSIEHPLQQMDHFAIPTEIQDSIN